MWGRQLASTLCSPRWLKAKSSVRRTAEAVPALLPHRVVAIEGMGHDLPLQLVDRIADLVTAVTLGVLTSPGPLQRLALDHPNLLTSSYPTVMTPAFAVPFSLILHGLSLWQLWRRRTSRCT